MIDKIEKVFDVASAAFGWAWDSKRQAVFHCRTGGSPPLPPAYQRPLGMFFASGGLQVLPATGLTKTVRLRILEGYKLVAKQEMAD